MRSSENRVAAPAVPIDDWHASGLSVGQVAERMGISRSAVRWYDDHGLLPSERVHGNHRRFFADVLCRIAMIHSAQRVGLSIAEIRDALSVLVPGRAPTEEDWERMAEHLRGVLGHRIDELLGLLDELRPGDHAQISARAGTSAGD